MSTLLDDKGVRLLLFFWFLSAPVLAQTCSVTLAANGVNSSKGVVGFVLFASPAGWPEDYKQGLQSTAVPAKPGTVEVKLSGITPGRYAAVALHDENENQKIDKKGSGRPKEGYGISRNPKVGLRAPKFEAAAFDLKCNDRIEVTLRYPKPTEK